MATAADVIRRLRFRYSTTLGIEVTHLAEEEERKWFRQLLTAEALTRPLTADEKQAVLVRLTEVDGLERFIRPGVSERQALLDRGHRCARAHARRGHR